MKLTFFTLFLFFFLVSPSRSFAQVVVSPANGFFVCTDQSRASISSKIDNIHTLAKSDDHLSFKLQTSNYLLSKISYPYLQMSESVVRKKNNQLFTLRMTMVPMPKAVTYKDTSKGLDKTHLLPHLSFACQKTSNGDNLKLQCKKVQSLPSSNFDDFKFSLQYLAHSSHCPSQNTIKVEYRATLNSAEFNELRAYIKKSMNVEILGRYVDDIFNPNAFFKSYLEALYQSYFE